MQKTQNADIQRVRNLVELYRTKVGEECDRAKEAMMQSYKDWFEYGIDQTQPNDEAQWEWVNVLSVNEQLLGHFYSVVAGENAEKDILQRLLPDLYDTSIFTQEEECFLVDHFREMVNYIIQTPSLIIGDYSSRWSDLIDDFLIPMEVLEIVKNRVDIPDTSVIYNLYAGLGQLATLYPSKAVYCSNEDDFCDKFVRVLGGKHDAMFYQRILAWLKFCVWARLSMYANKVRSLYIGNRKKTFDYDVLIAYIPYSTKTLGGEEMIKRTHGAYKELKERGKMVLLCPSSLLWRDSSSESLFRELLVKDCSIEEIIQLPSSVMKSHERDFCIIIAEKGRERMCTTFIDATKAFKQKRIYSEEDLRRNDRNVLDVEAWNTLLKNNGIDKETGLQKIAQLKSSTLNPNMLLPQICVLEKPSENEKPLSLSKLCNRVVSKVKEIGHDLPTDTLWVRKHNLSNAFQGALNVSILETAGCPNNPPHTNDYKFTETGEFIDEKDFKPPFMGNHDWAGLGQQTGIGMRVVDYRRCTFIDGTKDAVLFEHQGDGVSVALIRATGKPIAIDSGINVFVPNDDIDALSLVALLRLPIVYRQICAYEKFGLSNYIDDILVPTDLRIIRDEERSLKDEQETYKAQQEKFESMKTEYINEVRMRKHDMRPHMKQLNSAKNLMQYYVENMDSIPGVQVLLNNQIRRFSSALEYLSDLVEHFSDEEQFGEPERFDLHEFLSHIGEHHETEEYVIKYECDIKSIIDYNIHRQKELDDYMINQEIEDAIVQQEKDDYLLDQEIEDAVAQQEIEEPFEGDNTYVFEENQVNDDEPYVAGGSQVVDDEAYVFEETQANDDEPYMVGESQVIDDGAYVFEETQANDDEPYMVSESQVIDDGAYVFEETQANDDEPYMVDDTRAVDDEAYVMDGVWGKYLTSIPLSYMAPNDIQRLVDNILNNAWKHGFENSERNDHEVNVKLSIDTKRNMFQIDFRNNGNPLPDGMDKMRYGLLGEKAGKAGGTGIGGNYVKKFVEHYGGDYDVFMENGWVVIRIYLPIK